MFSTSVALFFDHDYVSMTRFAYCLLTQFFLPDFGADSFRANSSTAALFSAKFGMACWRPKRDHCPDRCEFLQRVVSSHTGSMFLGNLSEAALEPKLRENLFTGASRPGDEDNWPSWRGLTTTDSTASCCGFKKSLSFSWKKSLLLCYVIIIDFVRQDQ